MTANSLFTRFQQRLTAVGGEVHYVKNIAQAANIIAAHPALADGEIVVPPFSGVGAQFIAPLEQQDQSTVPTPFWSAVLPKLRDKGIAIREATDPAIVADAPAGLSGAELAVAETGSVLLADNALEARVVSMLTLTHFVLVREADLVPMLDDAGVLLQQLTKSGPDQRRYISLITGPSRTADIERTLTIGVQGPKALCVIIVKDMKVQP